MADDSQFLESILAHPDDDRARLVYADWLEERGDSRGELIRVELELAKCRPGSKNAPELRRRLQTLRRKVEPAWLADLDRPAVLRANPTPFPAAWWSTELPTHRNHPELYSTYSRFAYEQLPPVRKFKGDFAWLKGASARNSEDADVEYLGPVPTSGITNLSKAAARTGVSLPAEVDRFFRSRDLAQQIRSCTDCYFTLSKRLIPSPAGEGAHLFRFLADSQGCLFWYLYLADTGYHAILCGGLTAGDEDDPKADFSNAQLFFCGSSFEEFIYRFWIENELWFVLAEEDTRDLTPEEKAYVEHYKAGKRKPRKRS